MNNSELTYSPSPSLMGGTRRHQRARCAESSGGTCSTATFGTASTAGMVVNACQHRNTEFGERRTRRRRRGWTRDIGYRDPNVQKRGVMAFFLFFQFFLNLK